jgi:membrane peptidoglycan carboxypeptidase
MGNSLNIPAVKVEMSLGVDRVVDMARRMGAPPLMGHDDGNGAISFTSDDPATAYTPSLTLGGYSETALRMATGAAVLGAQGLLRQPYGIASVKDSAGNEIFKADPAKTAKQVIDPKVAFIMEQIMSDDSNRAAVFGTGTPLVLNGRRAGAKTGTSEDFRNTWTVGYTPSLATAVWFGNPDSVPLARLHAVSARRAPGSALRVVRRAPWAGARAGRRQADLPDARHQRQPAGTPAASQRPHLGGTELHAAIDQAGGHA